MRFHTLTLAALQLAASTIATPVAAAAAAPDAAEWIPRHLQASKHLRPVLERRDSPGFAQGQPFDGTKGAPLQGGTNRALDLQNPDNLGAQSTDNGVVPNLKWSFSDSKTRLLPGGWVREQIVSDLPPSKDIAGAQQHVVKGAYRELHWHRTAEWGYLYKGEILLYAVDESGRNTATRLQEGDIWYFPRGEAHGLQGLGDQNEYLLIFDDGNFEASGTTFNIADWLKHTPRHIVAKSLGVNETIFDSIPSPNPYIGKAPLAAPNETTASPRPLTGNSSYVFHRSQQTPVQTPGGTLSIVDSTNFPVAKTIASTIVTLKPGAIRELHWHPNADEWLYFHQGTARATVFFGGAAARTFDFSAGDTAVFPISTGHYVENTSETEDLVWIEVYKSDRVEDISLQQWLALTPPHIAAAALNTTLDVVASFKTEKQYIV